MKKVLFLCFIIVPLFTTNLLAQGIELTPYAGYLLGGKQNFYEGELKYRNAATYGFTFDVDLTWKAIEFYYSQTPTVAEWRPYLGWEGRYPSTDYDVSIHYFQVGGLGYAEIGSDAVKPFGAFTLGATWFQSRDERVQDNTQFSVTLGGGAKIFFSERLGIRLQGRLLLPMYFGGAGVGCGGGGCSTGVYASTNHLQGDFIGGVIIVLKPNE